MTSTLPKAGSLLKAAGLIAGVTIFSKILGAIRDWQIFNVYGASTVTDAYFAAVQIPWFAIILLGGIGGPFHTATVSVFSKILKPGESQTKESLQLANTLLAIVSGLFAVFAALTYFFAEPIMQVFLKDGSPELLALSTYHLKLMAPIVFFGGVIGIFYGLLNVYQHFFWPSISPAAMNLVIILTLWFAPKSDTGFWLAVATTIGAGLQLLVQIIPTFSRKCFEWAAGFDWQHPKLKEVAEILFPMIVGTTMGQLLVYVDLFFASQLDEGGWSSIILSNRLLQLPIGVLQTALLVPIFPRFGQYVADKNWLGLKTDFLKGVVSLWIISIPMLVVILLFSEPLIRVLFEHGSFDAGDTALVTLALVFQAFQIIPYFARDTLTRVFYAFGDSVTPLWVGITAIGIKFILNALLIKQFGLGGITLATSLITLINMTILAVLSKKHIENLGLKTLFIQLSKLLLAGLAMTGVILIAQQGLSHFEPDNQWLLLVWIAGLTTAGLGAYAVVLWLFKIPEFQYLQNMVMARLKR